MSAKESSFQAKATTGPNDHTNKTNHDFRIKQCISLSTGQQVRATVKQIIVSVPKKMKIRAKLLIKKLKNHSDDISWNDSGHLVFEVSIIPNFNIVDSVNGIMHEKKGLNPKPFKYICQNTHKIDGGFSK